MNEHAPSPTVVMSLVAVVVIGGLIFLSKPAIQEHPPASSPPKAAAPPPPVQPESAQPVIAASLAANGEKEKFVSALGRVKIGMRLYDRRTHQPFGIVTDIASGKVEVLRVDSFEIKGANARGYATWYDRSFITSQFDTDR